MLTAPSGGLIRPTRRLVRPWCAPESAWRRRGGWSRHLATCFAQPAHEPSAEAYARDPKRFLLQSITQYYTKLHTLRPALRASKRVVQLAARVAELSDVFDVHRELHSRTYSWLLSISLSAQLAAQGTIWRIRTPFQRRCCNALSELSPSGSKGQTDFECGPSLKRSRKTS